MGITIVGESTRVVETSELSIDELAGNVASKSDTLSIALVKAKGGASEPWLTLHYDEWICVLSGHVTIEVPAGAAHGNIEVPAGKTVHISPGTRFRPLFPVDTEYIPVCLPAFRPDRCIREDVDDVGKGIASKLQKLHHPTDSKAPDTRCATSTDEPKPETLYHMTTKSSWEAAKASGKAYYPATFEVDGNYTHATGVPSRLITTANHFYQDVAGEWVCVAFTRTALRDAGIFVRDEQALPVGATEVSAEWGEWVCPHVYGGIPTSTVHAVFLMKRDGKVFLSIEGVESA